MQEQRSKHGHAVAVAARIRSAEGQLNRAVQNMITINLWSLAGMIVWTIAVYSVFLAIQ